MKNEIKENDKPSGKIKFSPAWRKYSFHTLNLQIHHLEASSLGIER